MRGYPLPLGTTCNPELMGYVQAGLGTYDIAFEYSETMSLNDIWVATDQPDSPIRAYDPSGTLSFASDLVSCPRGMAFSLESGHRMLWVSDPLTETIYQIDLDPTGIGGGSPQPAEGPVLSLGSNPVAGTAFFTGAGFPGDAVLEVWSLSGRLMLREPFGGSLAWTPAAGEAPAGVYVAVVRDDTGAAASVRFTRLAI